MKGRQPDRTAGAIPARRALETAAAIAIRLQRDAIWSGQRCNWVGAEPMERIGTAQRGPLPGGGLTYRALGPDLYGGSSGVALFLAEAAAATGDGAAARSAKGAMHHALAQSADVEPRVRPGFYVGWSGIACAGIRVGGLLHVQEFVERGHALLTDLARELACTGAGTPGGRHGPAPDGATEPDPGMHPGMEWELDVEFDLVAGGAGAILALLEGYRRCGDDGLLAAAVMAADRLLRTARRSATGWSWRGGGPANNRGLTGLSHGAAGVAVALIEAFRATGNAAYADGARQAMRYEDHWFDREEGNWPDFRPDVDGGTAARRPQAFATLWCHGAPGIALSRWHAYRHLGGRQWLDDAAAAVRTTARATRSLLETGGANFSLCHGLLGNAECLREAGAALDVRSPTRDRHSPANVADRAALAGMERHASGGLPWPCGTHTEETPNLMLGLAGIGHHYLRRAMPETPSVLFPVAAT